MPYDPTKPAANTPASSAEMRAQPQALNTVNTDIQTRLTANNMAGAVAGAINGTDSNTNAVQTLGEQGINFGDSEKQQIADKLAELIVALRR